MHLGLKTGPLCPILWYQLSRALFLQKSSRLPPHTQFLITSGSKMRRNPGVNVKITTYSCLLPEFHLTGALCRSLTGVPYCGALHELWITLNLRVFSEVPYCVALPRLWVILSLNPTGTGEIQGLSKRFERFKFGIFYVLIVKIRYNFTHK